MSEQLSDEELAAIRALILADSRRQWIVSGIKGVSVWLAALATGYLAFKSLIADAIGWAVR